MAGKSVKVVAATSDAARAIANKNSTNVTNARKSGLVASQLASGVDVNAKPKTTVKIRTNPGISGKGGTMVGGVYKPMGGGMNWTTK